MSDSAVVAGWPEFLSVIAGTAGALVGLVFVAMSVNLARIIAQRGVTARAGETILLLSGTLAESLVALIPRLSTARLGWAVLLIALVTWALVTAIDLRAMRAHTYRRALHALVRAALHQLASVPAIVAGLCLISLQPQGMYWLAFANITSMLSSILIAWVLLVDVVR